MSEGVQLQLIGMAIDVLKWMEKPLYRLGKAIIWLRHRRVDCLVPLQFKYHELSKRIRSNNR